MLVLLLIAGSLLTWEKFFRTAPQDMQPGAAAFSPADMRFAYGSLGGEQLAGIPYPIFMVLPRVFPDLVQKYAAQGYGPEKRTWGGYGAFGLVWEQGRRLPVGLSIRRAGYERVTGNCALCHTATWRLTPADDEHIVLGGPAHTADLQALARFLFACAHDGRFTPERLLPEIALHFPLDAADKVLLASLIIPETRAELLLADRELGFMNTKTPWGPGRDDAFNLPKFLLAQEPWDDTVGNTDLPAVWKLANRDGGLLHAGGEARDLYSVIATSGLGTGSIPNSPARARTRRNGSRPTSAPRRRRPSPSPSTRASPPAARRCSKPAARSVTRQAEPAPARRFRWPRSAPIRSTCAPSPSMTRTAPISPAPPWASARRGCWRRPAMWPSRWWESGF